MSKAILTSLLTFFLFSTLLVSCYRAIVEAAPTTIYVPLVYPTIQEAVEQANPGDTIFVYNGTYQENVVINKSVSLIGEDRDSTVIDGQDAGTVISITADEVAIKGFTIRKSSQGLYNSGIYIAYSSNNSISHNRIEANYHGIYLLHSNDNVIAGNEVVSNDFHGIYLDYSANNVISGNNASLNQHDGISLHASDRNSISYNNASLNQHDGVYLYSSSDNAVFQNDFTLNSYHGVHLHSSDGNMISNNTVTSNENNGIHLDNSGNNAIFDCEIANNGVHGFYFFYSNDNHVFRNSVSRNEYGIRLQSSSSNNMFNHNNLLENEGQVWSESANDWSDGIEGNYWSDYAGLDSDQDGIGDAPYVIDANNRDIYPLMGPLQTFMVIWEEKAYGVSVITNSWISLFTFEAETRTGNKMITFNATGEDGTLGFCRIMIPTELTDYSLFVLVDGQEVPTTSLEAPQSSYVGAYFTYPHSSHSITVIASKLLHLYNQLLEEYSELQTEYGNLSATYQELLVSHYQLQEGYNAMNESLQSLLQTYSGIEAEYASLLVAHSQNIQSLVYISLATIIASVITTIYLSAHAHTRAPKTKESQS